MQGIIVPHFFQLPATRTEIQIIEQQVLWRIKVVFYGLEGS